MVDLIARIEEHLRSWGIFSPAYDLLRDALAELKARADG